MASVTDRWAQYLVAGPTARALLQNLLGGAIELGNEAFPFMAARDFQLGSVTARLARISFSGELAYEIAVPASRGDALARALMEAGCDSTSRLRDRGARRPPDREGTCGGRRTQWPDDRSRPGPRRG